MALNVDAADHYDHHGRAGIRSIIACRIPFLTPAVPRDLRGAEQRRDEQQEKNSSGWQLSRLVVALKDRGMYEESKP